MFRRLKRHWVGPAVEFVVGEQKVIVGQGQPVATITFKNPSIVRSLFISPSLAFGEAYMRGGIQIHGDMMQFLQGFVQSTTIVPRIVRQIRKALLYIPISIPKAIQNAQHHYDIGNDFYSLWLDPSKTYTCAYFLSDSDSLETAQFQKIDLVCKKIRLEKGMRLLDIGCGWGGALFHAATKYDAVVTGVTPAKEQAAYIREKAKQLGIEHKVRVLVAEYRNIPEIEKNTKYDRIISIGMFEQVGKAQMSEFFRIWKSMLKDDGISLLHTIGRTNEEDTGRNPWIEKYIFPGGYIPLLREIMQGAGEQQLLVADCENLWQHYEKTLNFWGKNVHAQQSAIVNMFDEQFFRMWTLYLHSCEAGFAWGDLQLYQTVMLGKDAIWPLNREVVGSLKKRPETV